MKKILCCGSVTADILVKPVDSIPTPGTLRSVESITTCVGGCATNCGIDLGKLGVPVAVSCRVGEDFYGEFIKAELKKYNVDISPVVTKGPSPTTLSIACIQSGGERSFLYNPASSADYCPQDIDWNAVDNSDIIFYTGAMLLTSFDGAPCAEFFKECQKRGKLTVFDTAWDFDDIWLPKLEGVFEYIDIFMPSYDDFKNTIAGGISKVNIFTDINCAASNAAFENYQKGCGITDLIPNMIEAIKKETEKKMKLFGSVNRA